jgi:hypothetical protein
VARAPWLNQAREFVKRRTGLSLALPHPTQLARVVREVTSLAVALLMLAVYPGPGVQARPVYHRISLQSPEEVATLEQLQALLTGHEIIFGQTSTSEVAVEMRRKRGFYTRRSYHIIIRSRETWDEVARKVRAIEGISEVRAPKRAPRTMQELVLPSIN